MTAEENLRLTIKSLEHFGVYPEIIKDMTNNLNKIISGKEQPCKRLYHYKCFETHDVCDSKKCGYKEINTNN